MQYLSNTGDTDILPLFILLGVFVGVLAIVIAIHIFLKKRKK
jgi:hypothetical protein